MELLSCLHLCKLRNPDKRYACIIESLPRSACANALAYTLMDFVLNLRTGITNLRTSIRL